MLTGVEWKNLDVTTIPQNETSELDVVLTDKNGITKRSEVGKTFTGGE